MLAEAGALALLFHSLSCLSGRIPVNKCIKCSHHSGYKILDAPVLERLQLGL